MAELITEIIGGEPYQYYPSVNMWSGLSVFVANGPRLSIPASKSPAPSTRQVPGKLCHQLEGESYGYHGSSSEGT